MSTERPYAGQRQQPTSGVAGDTSTTTPPTTNSGSMSSSRSGADMGEQASQMAGQVKDQAKQQVASKFDEQKGRAAQGLGSASRAVAQVGDQLRQQNPTIASFADQAADRLRALSSHLEQRDFGELVDDVEQLARRNPALFAGGAFVIGLLGARLLKSSGDGASSNGQGARMNYGSGYPRYGAYDIGVSSYTPPTPRGTAGAGATRMAGDQRLNDPTQRVGYGDPLSGTER